MRHEVATIRAFVVQRKRERYLAQLADAKQREKFTRQLAHFRDLDPRFTKPIPPVSQTPDRIASLLRRHGAPPSCWVISEDPRLDARAMDLITALQQVVGYGMGTLLCCLPGTLAYFEGEDERLLLERPQPKGAEVLVRFIAAVRDPGSHREEGIFQAASRLLDAHGLTAHDARALQAELRWFAEHLNVPHSFSRARQPRAICWFRSDAQNAMGHVWAMVRLLESHGIGITKITTDRPGYVVYEDDLQVAAEPFQEGTFKA